MKDGDGNGKDIPKDNYDIVEENGKIELKFKDDVYIIGKDSNKQDTLRLNNIPEGSKKVYDKIAITYDVVKEKGKDVTSTSIVNANDNKLDENGNDKSGISAKAVIISEEKKEEKEDLKETSIEVVKTMEKENPKDVDTNKISVSITNKGEYIARDVLVEEKIGTNGKVVKDTVRVLDGKGKDVTGSITDLKVVDDKITFSIGKLDKKESYKLVYDIKYSDIEKKEEITSVSKVKAKNSKEEIVITKNMLDATVKETELEIEKTVEKKELRAGERNTYTVVVRNVGKYDAKDVEIEDTLIGNGRYIAESVKIENSEELEVEHLGNARFKIRVLPKGKELRVRYKVEYLKQEEDSVVTNKVSAKGSNTNKAEPKEKEGVRVKVLGVQDIVQKILPKAGRENSRLWIYGIIAFVILLPSMILRKEYIEAKKRQRSRMKKRK